MYQGHHIYLVQQVIIFLFYENFYSIYENNLLWNNGIGNFVLNSLYLHTIYYYTYCENEFYNYILLDEQTGC